MRMSHVIYICNCVDCGVIELDPLSDYPAESDNVTAPMSLVAVISSFQCQHFSLDCIVANVV